MAKQRNYKAEYERRKARATKRGFRSPREETKFQAVKKTRTKKLTIYNYRQIQEAKRRKAAKERELNKIRKTQALEKAKARVLKQFGLTQLELNKLRKQNRAYSLTAHSPRLFYNLALDEDINNWTAERIGYIKYYNEVFVNPKPRRTVAAREKAQKLIERWDLFSDYQEMFDFADSPKDKKRRAA
jgi:hypothetical protein